MEITKQYNKRPVHYKDLKIGDKIIITDTEGDKEFYKDEIGKTVKIIKFYNQLNSDLLISDCVCKCNQYSDCKETCTNKGYVFYYSQLESTSPEISCCMIFSTITGGELIE